MKTFTRLRVALLLSVPIVVMGCNAPLYSIEVEAQEICVANLTVPFDANQGGALVQEDLGGRDLGILSLDGFESSIEVLSVAMAPTDGVADLAFVDHLIVDMAGAEPDLALDPLRLVQLTQEDRIDGGALYREPETAVDVTTYMDGGNVVLLLDLVGQVPDHPWTASMDVCFSASAWASESL